MRSWLSGVGLGRRASAGARGGRRPSRPACGRAAGALTTPSVKARKRDQRRSGRRRPEARDGAWTSAWARTLMRRGQRKRRANREARDGDQGKRRLTLCGRKQDRLISWEWLRAWRGRRGRPAWRWCCTSRASPGRIRGPRACGAAWSPPSARRWPSPSPPTTPPTPA